MTSLDKAGIAVVVAVLVIFLGVAAAMSASQDAGPVASAPVVAKTTEPKIQAESDISMTDKAEEEAVMEAAEEEAAMKKAEEAAAGPETHIVDVPLGTSVPGCEETNSCWSPADITINAGDTVEWVNVDTAAHTVTGGSPADGPSGVFDSSLLMADASYTFTFEDTGSYDYFCMVHPWMVGSVTAN